MLNGATDGVGTDMISSIQTRRSMQSRRSVGDPARHSIGSNGYGRSDREGLIRAYDEEENLGFGLTDLAEESEDDAPLQPPNGKANGKSKTRTNVRSLSLQIDPDRRIPKGLRSPNGSRSPAGSRSPLRSPR
jgi:hypothetical protein